jgi:biopolymer transport protein ExbB
VGFSVATWSLILIKAVQHIRLSRDNKRFTQAFWHAPNLQAAAELSEQAHGPAARLSAAGLQVLRDDAADDGADLEHTGERQDLLERALRQQIHKERRKLESGLAALASIGSTAPFVGLFGTVWGIMNALTDISKAGSASLEVVAGPIGEALVATGIGIAVAVPAVLAYNVFLRRLKIANADLDELGADLISLSRKNRFRIARRKPVVAVGTDRPTVAPRQSNDNSLLPTGTQPA